MTTENAVERSYEHEDLASWLGPLGVSWLDRNPATVDALNEVYRKNYGIDRTMLNAYFLRDVPRNVKILEVGCGVGVQLEALELIGFTDLHGCDVQPEAVARCRFPAKVVDLLKPLPYADGEFDLVFTSGVLVHVPMEMKKDSMSELARISKRWIWGFEYEHSIGMKVEFTIMPPAWLAPHERLWVAEHGMRLLRTDRFPGLFGQEDAAVVMHLLEKR